MSTTHGHHAARLPLPLHRGSSQGSGGLLIAAGLFLAVVIAECGVHRLGGAEHPRHRLALHHRDLTAARLTNRS